MTEQFANNAFTTLNGGITSGATTLVVLSATGFPTSPQFRILVDTEIMLVTGVSGTTFTVSRGQESTSAAAHLSGATVSQILTNGALQQFRADNVLSGTFASRPAAGIAGRIYRPTDGNIGYFDTGITWSPWGPIMPLITPPAAANFSIVQTGGNTTLVDDNGGLYFSAVQRVTTDDVVLAAQSNPGGLGAAYTMTIGMLPASGGKNGTAGFFNYSAAGIGIYNTSTTQYKGILVYGDSTGAFHYQGRYATGLTASALTVFDVGAYTLLSGPMIWLRLQDDGVNLNYYHSTDGRHWRKSGSETRSTNMSSQPDKLGLWLDALNADAQMTVLSYSLTSP